MTRPAVVVVGAGISGLAAAWAAHQAGCRVTVLEQATRTGGVLVRGAVGLSGPVIDLGAESLLARRPEAVALAENLGLTDDLVVPQVLRAAVYHNHRLHPMPAGTLMGIPTDPLALLGLLSADEVARVQRAGHATWPGSPHDSDVASWVAARTDPAVLERLVEPLLGGVYAGRVERLSLRATLAALAPVLAGGQALLPAVAALVEAGSRSSTPVFLGLRGGVARLAETATRRLTEAGVSIRTGCCVQGLRRDGRQYRLTVRNRDRSTAEIDTDAVILAVPAAATGRLLGDLAPEAARLLAGVEQASMALVAAVLPAGTLESDLSGVLVPAVAGRVVKAMTFSSSKWAWVREAAGGADVIRLSVGRAGSSHDLHRPDYDLAATAISDAADILDRPLEILRWRVVRWGGGLPQYAVGHLDLVAAARQAIDGHRGLAVCGAVWDGVGIAACVATAEQAVRRLLQTVA